MIGNKRRDVSNASKDKAEGGAPANRILATEASKNLSRLLNPNTERSEKGVRRLVL